ncbi:MAG: hypothetical protein JW715_02765 [Sedimentisphaerales bacterium]|nr:hypothetical protein [Sedimentisphaerales bacterium]
MENRKSLQVVVGIVVIVLAAGVFAQDEQWLQYHSERQAYQIVGDMGSSTSEPSTSKPEGVKLPDFKNEEPFFFEWSSPMVEGGKLWIALDRTNPQGHYDRLYIDSNGNGHLDDETVINPYQTEQYYTYFGPVKVVFKGQDGPITYHLDFRFLNYNEQNKRLYIFPACWYEGQITVGGKTKYCVLIDQNINGVFNDKSLEAYKSDRIRIGEKGDRDSRYVGKYIEVDGVLYEPEIARDGAYIKLTKAENVKYGSIRLPDTITEFSAGGENGLFNNKPENGKVTLPVGKYRISSWAIDRVDDNGGKWKLQGNIYNDKGDFDIKEGQLIEQLSIGEPIVSNLTAQASDEGAYAFRQTLEGKLGENISLTLNGSRPQAPKLHIKSEDGQYDRTYSFSYG